MTYYTFIIFEINLFIIKIKNIYYKYAYSVSFYKLIIQVSLYITTLVLDLNK